jgi:hypothetical protein
MKAAIALLADYTTQNFARKTVFELDQKYPAGEALVRRNAI